MKLLLMFLWIIIANANICCYYRQHYHNAYCGYTNTDNTDNTENKTNKNDIGCVLGPALVVGAPKVICSEGNDCLPGMFNQGYWLLGFKNNCTC